MEAPENYYNGVTFSNFKGYDQIFSTSFGGKNVLIHEIGHAFDHSLNLSEKQELKSLFNTEANKLFLFDPYYRSDEQEFFAQSFVLYLTTPKFLEWLAPQTFHYFDDLISTEIYENS